ncbi:hypothetical protein [Mesorhizobium sp. CN2-181]|uniref:hypothetical protein n=1 Tax=Mesorhizobium yinganensis TaxID=3157707 RepID=UPI0032B85F52
MPIPEFGELALGSAIDQYIASRLGSKWPVSLNDAVRAVRLMFKAPDVTDDELGALIAAVAVSKGHNVIFDLHRSVQASAGWAMLAG